MENRGGFLQCELCLWCLASSVGDCFMSFSSLHAVRALVPLFVSFIA